MKETKRIISLFEKLYDGNPWIDVNIIDTLQGISSQQASVRILDKSNTIWEIVNHMISWRQNVLKRLQGKMIKTPQHNYFEPVKDKSGSAWLKTIEKFADTEINWLEFLRDFKANNFSNIYSNNGLTYYEHIHGIIQHDAYHLGQIRLIITLMK